MMEIRNKRILLVGAGKSGLSAALFLRRQGAQVTLSDSRSAEALEHEISVLRDAGVTVEAGPHRVDTFLRQDLIVVSPGVPVDTPELVQACEAGVSIIGELELASRFLQGPVLAVTGSNGKTTTTTLLGKIFADAGLPTLVGGNIGTPVIELIAPSTPETWSVLEVSSFQLETTDEFHPRIAVVLNITPDHLDRHGSFENYAAIKGRITLRQTEEDFLVLNAEDKPTQMVAARSRARVYWFSPKRQIKQGAFVHGESILFTPAEGKRSEPVMPVAEIPLKGAHNVENVLAAVCAARLAGTSAESIRASVKSFVAVEHRLEFVAEIGGVAYYNDSKATNVDAAVKALEAFPKGVHLILGGKDKGSDYTAMSKLLQERVKTVYTIGSAAEKIERQLAGVVKISSAGTMQAAVADAAKVAVAGDVVLLAPACASFDQFENYGHRGRVFKDLVKRLQG